MRRGARLVVQVVEDHDGEEEEVVEHLVLGVEQHDVLDVRVPGGEIRVPSVPVYKHLGIMLDRDGTPSADAAAKASAIRTAAKPLTSTILREQCIPKSTRMSVLNAYLLSKDSMGLARGQS